MLDIWLKNCWNGSTQVPIF